MSKILFITVLLLALASAKATSGELIVENFDLERVPFVTMGGEGEMQLFGFSIRNVFFYFIKSGVKGYIAGYEGRYTIPKECLDE